ncbi:ABC transporter ATP-binding protein [Paenibacillus abyssi]|uniref:ABC transporter domain-containing protein n=1 Tax=Paenibacillus abyssi TaxID=1340531 RepID=A0A917G0G3_9BACL|nr:ABC transporter ATP-binding protein [Paenibacillus abyssi]GGG16302.1 hypothetical protein GCM10010916_36530 [Paenibacillus abyssi]
MNNDEAVIRLTEVEQSRAHFKLGPLNLNVPKGYVTAIVGPNGSGKSSTFRLLLDLAKADRGSMEMFGEPVGRDDVKLKQRVGYLPDDSLSEEDSLRGSERAAFTKIWYPGWDVNRYTELLNLFEVNPDLKLGKMSKGMRRKFELTLALSHDPELLLLDEPSSGLDPLAWKKMIEVLHHYMEQGNRTILMATHIIDEVRRLADYIVFLVNGRALGVYEKDELFSSWHIFYVQDERSVYELLSGIPGIRAKEKAGGGVIKVITNKAMDAEKWLQKEGIKITGRTPMELDEIMASLIDNDRLRMRQS